MCVYVNNEQQSRPQHWPPIKQLNNQPTNQPTKQQKNYLNQNEKKLINV
jgi:hypothetical protein